MMGRMLFKLTTKNIPSNSHLYGVKQKSKREEKDSYTQVSPTTLEYESDEVCM
jgi:hypothetical protein